MQSSGYGLAKKDKLEFFGRALEATKQLVRHDEAIRHFKHRSGVIIRDHYRAAVASIYLQGGLVHVDDLLLLSLDAGTSIADLDINEASAIISARQLIESRSDKWLFTEGSMIIAKREKADEQTAPLDEFAKQIADIDALLERTSRILTNHDTMEAKPQRLKRLLVPQNDDERWQEWQKVLSETETELPVLRAALILDGWNVIGVLPNKPWLGYEYANAALRSDLGLSHLPSITTGMRQIPRKERQSSNRLVRLRAIINAIILSAEQSMRGYLNLKTNFETMDSAIRKIRCGSRIGDLVDYAMNRPLFTAPMAAADLRLSQAGVLKMIRRLGLSELTSRSRYQVWGIGGRNGY